MLIFEESFFAGMVRDAHLAKRFYDMAAETSQDALWPVSPHVFEPSFASSSPLPHHLGAYVIGPMRTSLLVCNSNGGFLVQVMLCRTQLQAGMAAGTAAIRVIRVCRFWTRHSVPMCVA